MKHAFLLSCQIYQENRFVSQQELKESPAISNRLKNTDFYSAASYSSLSVRRLHFITSVTLLHH